MNEATVPIGPDLWVVRQRDEDGSWEILDGHGLHRGRFRDAQTMCLHFAAALAVIDRLRAELDKGWEVHQTLQRAFDRQCQICAELRTELAPLRKLYAEELHAEQED